MKKVLVILSLICFVAVNISKAQTTAPVAKQEAKKEVVATAKTSDKAEAKSGCTKTSAACCKNGKMKDCTPEQRAACEHAGKAKADATTPTTEKKEGAKANGN